MLPRVNLIRSEMGDYLGFADEFIATQLFKTGKWENHLVDVALQFVRDIESPLVIDIGANLGAFTIPVAIGLQHKIGSQVISFEPQLMVYYQLCGNVFLNRLDNVMCKNEALGLDDGVLEIPRPNYELLKNIGAFSMDEKIRQLNGSDITLPNKFDLINLRKLDSYELDRPPSFIKLDVEGFELNVIKGAVNFLEMHRFPPIAFEAWTEPWFSAEKAELISFVQGLGYQIQTFGGYDNYAQHPQHPIAFDLIARTPEFLEAVRVR